MKYQSVLLFLLVIGSVSGCDSTSLPTDESPVLIRNLVISPSQIIFTSEDGVRDTTISIDLRADVSGNSEQNPVEYSIVNEENNENEELTGTLLPSENESRVEASVNLTVSTTEFITFRVFVFGFNSNTEGEIVEGKIKISGISTSPPQIVEAFNTEIVEIPPSGQEQISFFARVVHPVEQTLIDRVEFFLIDQTGERLGGGNTTFEMFDDGEQNLEQGFIDETASDSLYSRALFIDETNQPDMIDVFYFATDISGLRSDTVQTQLEILE